MTKAPWRRPSQWSMWSVSFNGRLLFLVTPLFVLMLSDGGVDWLRCMVWWGFRFLWSYNRESSEGDLIFLKEKEVIFRQYTREYLYSRKLEVDLL